MSAAEGEQVARQCMICLDEWTSTGNHRLTSLKCGHLFGLSCVEKWIKIKKSCPSCSVPAKKSDLRNIFCANIVVRDNSERDHIKKRCEKERKGRLAAEIEKATLAQKVVLLSRRNKAFEKQVQILKRRIESLVKDAAEKRAAASIQKAPATAGHGKATLAVATGQTLPTAGVSSTDIRTQVAARLPSAKLVASKVETPSIEDATVPRTTGAEAGAKPGGITASSTSRVSGNDSAKSDARELKATSAADADVDADADDDEFWADMMGDDFNSDAVAVEETGARPKQADLQTGQVTVPGPNNKAATQTTEHDDEVQQDSKRPRMDANPVTAHETRSTVQGHTAMTRGAPPAPVKVEPARKLAHSDKRQNQDKQTMDHKMAHAVNRAPHTSHGDDGKDQFELDDGVFGIDEGELDAFPGFQSAVKIQKAAGSGASKVRLYACRGHPQCFSSVSHITFATAGAVPTRCTASNARREGGHFCWRRQSGLAQVVVFGLQFLVFRLLERRRICSGWRQRICCLRTRPPVRSSGATAAG